MLEITLLLYIAAAPLFTFETLYYITVSQSALISQLAQPERDQAL